jgi:hypothetical protein
MKVFVNNKVYISNHDIKFLLREHYAMPLIVLLEIDDRFVEDYDKLLRSKIHDFMSFTSEEAKEYFKGLDFIIDYNEFKDKSVDELRFEQKINEINKKRIENTLPTLSGYSVQEAELKLAKYGHIIYSFGELINYKKGTLRFNIPRQYSKNDIKRLKFVCSMFNNGKNSRSHETR